MGLVDDHVHELVAGPLLVQLGGGEVHVAGRVLPGLDGHLADQVLGAAALVRGHDVLVAVVGADGLFQVVEVAAAGLGLVAQHQRRPGHGAGARIGEQVNVDALGA